MLKSLTQKHLVSWFTSEKTLRVISAVILIASVGVSLVGLPHLSFEYSFEQFVKKGSTYLQTQEQVAENFSLAKDPPLIMMVTSESSWLNEEKIQKLKTFSNATKSIPHATRSLSLTEIEGAWDEGDDFYVGPVIDTTPQSHWNKRFLTDPLIQPRFISKDGRRVSILIFPEDRDMQKISSLLRDFEKLGLEHFPNEKVEVGGLLATQSEMILLIKDEIVIMAAISLLLSLISLLLLFKNSSGIVICLLGSGLSNATFFGTMGLLGYPISLMLTTAPLLLTVISMTMLMHSCVHWAHSKESSDSICRRLFSAHVLTALTTVVGFFVIAYNDISTVYQYGLGVAMGTSFSLAISVATFRLLSSRLPRAQTRSWTQGTLSLADITQKSSAKAVVLAVLFLGLGFYSFGQLSWTSRLNDDLPTDHSVRQVSENIDRGIGGLVPLNVTIHASQGAWKDPEHLRRLQESIETIIQHEHVGSALSITNVLRELHGGKIPQTRPEVAENLFSLFYGESQLY